MMIRQRSVDPAADEERAISDFDEEVPLSNTTKTSKNPKSNDRTFQGTRDAEYYNEKSANSCVKILTIAGVILLILSLIFMYRQHFLMYCSAGGNAGEKSDHLFTSTSTPIGADKDDINDAAFNYTSSLDVKNVDDDTAFVVQRLVCLICTGICIYMVTSYSIMCASWCCDDNWGVTNRPGGPQPNSACACCGYANHGQYGYYYTEFYIPPNYSREDAKRLIDAQGTDLQRISIDGLKNDYNDDKSSEPLKSKGFYVDKKGDSVILYDEHSAEENSNCWSRHCCMRGCGRRCCLGGKPDENEVEVENVDRKRK